MKMKVSLRHHDSRQSRSSAHLTKTIEGNTSDRISLLNIQLRLGELPKQIRQLVHRCNQQAHDRFEGRMFARARVAASRDKHLGVAEAFCECLTGLTLALLERCFQADEVLLLFALDVLGEGTPEFFELGDVFRVGGRHGLEDLEAFFDLDGNVR
jgi:hypothetical protein